MDTHHIGHLLSKEAIQALDEMYPLTLPNPTDTDRELWMKVGERRLVEVLKAKFAEANEGILNVFK